MTGWRRSKHCAAGDCIWLCAYEGKILLGHGNAGGPLVTLGPVERSELDAFVAGWQGTDFDSVKDAS